MLKLHGRAFGLSATGRVYPYPHFGGGPLLDYFWLTGSEAMALVPPNPAAGDSVAVPDWFARRLRLYRMLSEPLEGTGLPAHRKLPHAEKAPSLTLTVEEVSGGEVRMRLDGSVPIRFTAWDAQNRPMKGADFDCDYRFLGYVTFDRGKGAFTRFDLVALGAVEQLGSYKYPRPQGGKLMLGVTFELGDGTPAETIPPYALRNGQFKTYFAHDE